jgi:N-acetylneuraminic acid mutarotase
MHIFDMKAFLADPHNPQVRLTCKKVQATQGVPSTRWGHAASTYNGKLYIVGGRNDQDVIDIHEFSPETMTWKELEINGPLPKPRRRHSAVFVSGSLLMFGGFDGNFYNDL